MRHFLDFSDATLSEWEKLYRLFDDMVRHPMAHRDLARGKTMAALFYEPSTRTTFSFQSAMMRLGGGVFAMNNPGSTSVAKGETLKDTIIMCSGYADVIVLRHASEGAAMAASLYSRVPVINAGDGGHLHPTQTLTDLATLHRLRGGVSGLRIGLCGDLKYGRTVHSLLRALTQFDNVKFTLIAPPELAIPDYVRTLLKQKGQDVVETIDLEGALPALDVLYMTRVQKERFSDLHEYERLKGTYVLTEDKLRAAPKDMLILHPLPRVDEISAEVDHDPRAAYFEQARLGMYMRMALLAHLLDQPARTLSLPEEGGVRVCINSHCVTVHETYLSPLTHKGNCRYCEAEILI